MINQMVVSRNMSTPKSSILIDGIATLNHLFVETSIQFNQILKILTTDHRTPVDRRDLLIALDHRGLHPVGGWVVSSVSIRFDRFKGFFRSMRVDVHKYPRFDILNDMNYLILHIFQMLSAFFALPHKVRGTQRGDSRLCLRMVQRYRSLTKSGSSVVKDGAAGVNPRLVT